MRTLQMRTPVTYQLSIIQYPSGRYGFVGSVPIDLCREVRDCWNVPSFQSKIYESREAAEQEAKGKGYKVK